MKKYSTLPLLQLKFALEHWENLNLSAHATFAATRKMGDTTSDKSLTARIGSEISQGRLPSFVRPIKDYQLLRKHLENGTDFNPLDFLPRVPKDLKSIILYQEDVVEMLQAGAILLFPLFIKSWLTVKKVCEVADCEKIPFIDPCAMSYLSYLPYSTFILSLTKPMVYTVKDPQTKESFMYTYQNFFVRREGNILSILGVPDMIEQFVLVPEQKKALLNLADLPVRNPKEKEKFAKAQGLVLKSILETRKKFYPFSVGRYNIVTGEMIMAQDFNWKRSRRLTTKKGIDNEDEVRSKLTDLLHKEWGIESIHFLLNGIGKLFFEYVAPQAITVHTVDVGESKSTSIAKAEVVATESDETQEWFEVSTGNITYLTFHKDKFKGKGFAIRTGNEIGPHWRIPHDRNFRNKDGQVIKTVKVAGTWVREDLKDQGVPIVGSKKKLK